MKSIRNLARCPNKNGINLFLLYLLALSYMFSYSEKPLAVLVLVFLIINTYVKQTCFALAIVGLDVLLQYMFSEGSMSRFLQNWYTIALLLSAIALRKVKFTTDDVNKIYYFALALAGFRFFDNYHATPIVFFLNENLIGILLFSLMVKLGYRLSTTAALVLLSVKGLAIGSLMLLPKKNILYALLAISMFTVVLFFANSGLLSELVSDLHSRNYTSGRLDVWRNLLDKYYLGANYNFILSDGVSNAESFFINQVFSAPYAFPFVWALTLTFIFREFKDFRRRALAIFVCVIYPFPQFLFLVSVLCVVEKNKSTDCGSHLKYS